MALLDGLADAHPVAYRASKFALALGIVSLVIGPPSTGSVLLGRAIGLLLLWPAIVYVVSAYIIGGTYRAVKNLF